MAALVKGPLFGRLTIQNWAMGRGIFNSVPDETSFEGAVTEQPPDQSLYNGRLVFGRFYGKQCMNSWRGDGEGVLNLLNNS